MPSFHPLFYVFNHFEYCYTHQNITRGGVSPNKLIIISLDLAIIFNINTLQLYINKMINNEPNDEMINKKLLIKGGNGFNTI